MQFKTIAALFTLAAVGYTQDVDNNDIPTACRSVCQSVVQLTTDCDRRIDDDSVAYRNCICQAQNARNDVPNCAACVSANGGTDFDDDDDTTPENDVVDIIRACNFPTTTWNSGAAATGTGAPGTPVGPAGTTTGTGTLATTPTSAAGTPTSATTRLTGTTGVTGATGTAAGTGVTQFTGAAAMPTAGVKYLGLAALIGLPVVL
ncbi:putative gpi anchored protein [Neofusicoccum parvum UCRNP2]|uniref:Putative gpi anchored protein n=1 Tax=Botryosphaeria parva (strain UCR-NP2) TaxID=1287680 RepID=R1GKE5_BOTPV|nr:putative gpi anchored protein [Neofusicoccum parvum UCRNP2]